MRWFTSDTHFSHTAIMLHCQRPFASVHEMNKVICERWNHLVSKNDTIYHLGDFAFPKCVDPSIFLEKLNGNIIHIRGNHDKPTLCAKMPLSMAYSAIKIGNYKCLLNHRPILPVPMRNDQDDPYSDHDGLVPFHNYDVYLTGHIHNNYIEERWRNERGFIETRKIGRIWTGFSLNLSQEVHGFMPVSEEDVLKMIEWRMEHPMPDVISVEEEHV